MGELKFRTHQAPESPVLFQHAIWDNMRPDAPAGNGTVINFPMSNRVRLWMVNLWSSNDTVFLQDLASHRFAFSSAIQFVHKDRGQIQFELPTLPYDHEQNDGATTAVNPWPARYHARTTISRVTTDAGGVPTWGTLGLHYGWINFHGGLAGSKYPWQATTPNADIGDTENWQRPNKMLFHARTGLSDISTPTGNILRLAAMHEINVICNQVKIEVLPWAPASWPTTPSDAFWSFGSCIVLPEWV